jgi:UDP-N-acetylglucosamine--dolichyl-phosphate N-acetylglucosaminephosphotransferase
MFGMDLGKKGTARESVQVPEAAGLVAGTVFLSLLLLLIPFYPSPEESPSITLIASLFSILFMLMLGFTDDVLDWPWRYKLVLPLVGCIPVCACYSGSTSVLLPTVVRSVIYGDNAVSSLLSSLLTLLGVTLHPDSPHGLVDLHTLYYIFISLLSIFTTNSINIYAGINGLEVSQVVVTVVFVLLHNLLEIYNNSINASNHVFSLTLALPFLGCLLALLKFNWYPASVFVGDTFCYFSGMTLAVLGIHGHFSKTLLLFLLPQLLNFLYSIPQLAKIVPCPRHRLPKFNAATNTMSPSEYSPGKANMTLINATLRLFGPLHEATLSWALIGVQVLGCSIGMWVRYGGGARIFFEEEN